jgi:hypothetical protein
VTSGTSSGRIEEGFEIKTQDQAVQELFVLLDKTTGIRRKGLADGPGT